MEEKPTISDGLKHLARETALIRACQPLSMEDRLSRIERAFSVLVEALALKGAADLEEVQRKLAELD